MSAWMNSGWVYLQWAGHVTGQSGCHDKKMVRSRGPKNGGRGNVGWGWGRSRNRETGDVLHVEVHKRHHRETEVHSAHELRRLLEVVVPHGRRDELATIRALSMPAPSGRRTQSALTRSSRIRQQDIYDECHVPSDWARLHPAPKTSPVQQR